MTDYQDVPLPGTLAYAQDLADWGYGPVPPRGPEQVQLWKAAVHEHLRNVPKEARAQHMQMFKPLNHLQVQEQISNILAGVFIILMFRASPVILGSSSSYMGMPLIFIMSFVFAYVIRKGYQSTAKSSWKSSFMRVGLTPPDLLTRSKPSRRAK